MSFSYSGAFTCAWLHGFAHKGAERDGGRAAKAEGGFYSLSSSCPPHGDESITAQPLSARPHHMDRL